VRGPVAADPSRTPFGPCDRGPPCAPPLRHQRVGAECPCRLRGPVAADPSRTPLRSVRPGASLRATPPPSPCRSRMSAPAAGPCRCGPGRTPFGPCDRGPPCAPPLRHHRVGAECPRRLRGPVAADPSRTPFGPCAWGLPARHPSAITVSEQNVRAGCGVLSLRTPVVLPSVRAPGGLPARHPPPSACRSRMSAPAAGSRRCGPQSYSLRSVRPGASLRATLRISVSEQNVRAGCGVLSLRTPVVLPSSVRPGPPCAPPLRQSPCRSRMSRAGCGVPSPPVQPFASSLR